METQTRYTYLEHHPDKRTQELFIRGTGVRTLTIWHDRYIARMTPQQIAREPGSAGGGCLGSLGVLPRPLGGDLRRKGRRACVA